MGPFSPLFVSDDEDEEEEEEEEEAPLAAERAVFLDTYSEFEFGSAIRLNSLQRVY